MPFAGRGGQHASGLIVDPNRNAICESLGLYGGSRVVAARWAAPPYVPPTLRTHPADWCVMAYCIKRRDRRGDGGSEMAEGKAGEAFPGVWLGSGKPTARQA